MKKLKILLLANYYHSEHAKKIKSYHPLNKTASSWNSALITELKKLEIELHIVQFYPVLKKYTFKENNVTYYYLPRLPKIDVYTSLLKRLRVHHLARKIKPNLIHGIGSEHGYAYAAIQAGWPSVITIHGYLKMINRLSGHKSLLKQAFLEREENKALTATSSVIAINGYMRDLFVQNGCHSDKIKIIPNALNPVFLSSCPNDDSNRYIDIIMVGTLHPLKNQHTALEIFSLIKSKYKKNVSVVIVGSPTVSSQTYHAELLSKQAANNLDNVHFYGSIDQQELKKLYCRSKVLLHISEFEADPTVVAEAMACGVLPVVNPVAGLAYRVQPSINGYHVDIKNHEKTAIDLISILNQYNDARSLIQRGREMVISERDPTNVAVATLKAYHSILQSFANESSYRLHDNV